MCISCTIVFRWFEWINELNWYIIDDFSFLKNQSSQLIWRVAVFEHDFFYIFKNHIAIIRFTDSGFFTLYIDFYISLWLTWSHIIVLFFNVLSNTYILRTPQSIYLINVFCDFGHHANHLRPAYHLIRQPHTCTWIQLINKSPFHPLCLYIGYHKLFFNQEVVATAIQFLVVALNGFRTCNNPHIF